MVFPKPYAHPSQQIATYDWVDLASGTGYVNYTCHSSQTSGAAVDYHLTTSDTLYSQTIETLGSSTALDIDFDLTPFNFPTIIDGTAIVNFVMYGQSTVDSVFDVTCTVYVRKWNGTTETDIGSVQIPNSRINGTETHKRIRTAQIDLTKTTFKKGDVLRVTFNLGYNLISGSGVYIVLGHDPRNRDGTYIIPSTDDPDTFTNTTISIPYEIRD